MIEKINSKYRWYILVLIGMTGGFVIAMPQMCMPVLFKEIADELNLSLVQIGVVWGMIPLAGLVLMLFSGVLADKFGAKRMLVIGCLLTGITGMLRATSDTFTMLTVSMFVFGALQVITAPAMIKMLGIWFTGKHLGLANGVMSMSMGFGFLLSSLISATVLSPLFGGWRGVLVAYGVVNVIVGILWFFSRGVPENSNVGQEIREPVTFKESFLQIIRIRNVWILTCIALLQVSGAMGMIGYVPTYLKNIGWEPAVADNAIALFHGVSMSFTIPIVLLSNKLKSRKVILFGATFMTAIGIGIMALNSGSGVWVAMIVAGIVRDGFMATHMTMLLETKGVETKYIGVAVGVTQSIGRIGEILSPPIGNSLAAINPQYPFFMWSGMAVLALFVFLFFKKDRNGKTVQN